MKSRVVVFGVGAISMLTVVATSCGSSSGTGASPATTIKLGTAVYQTLVPATSTIPPPTVAGQVGAVVSGEQSHTVAAGEYLYGIAKNYCVKADDIVTYNGWVDGVNHPLTPGDAIKIPPNGCLPGTVTAATSAPIATTVATAAPTTVPPSVPIGGTYTVASGDFLKGIAAKTGTTVAGIIAANGWADGENHVIIPGQKINLPVKSG